MYKKILLILAALTFIVSCSTTQETAEDGKQDQPQNLDSDITFDGVSSPDEDPFFSEPIEGDQNMESAEVNEENAPAQEEEVDLPTPTPEPSADPDPAFAETEAPDEEYEAPTPDPIVTEEPTPIADKQPASVDVPDAMRSPDADCSLRTGPGTDSQRVGVARQGRKIWTENHNSGWFKVYRKKGHAFVSKSCF